VAKTEVAISAPVEKKGRVPVAFKLSTLIGAPQWLGQSNALGVLSPAMSPSYALCIHESAFQVAAKVLGVTVRPPMDPRRTLRVVVLEVVDWDDDYWPESDVLEAWALLMSIGHAALQRLGVNSNDRDWVEARSLIAMATTRRRGEGLKNANVKRETEATHTQVTREAERFITAHLGEIERLATDFAARVAA
jgi:hypothetical protein